MKILVALTYFRPHISGLTIYVERLTAALAARGHRVTVLTSRYDAALPAQELIDGVRVVRAPVWMRISKGVIMPGFGDIARALLREHDVLNIHVPQFDAAGLAVSAKCITHTPVVLTYHCDLRLPPGRFNRVAGGIISAANLVATTLADRVVTSTEDYAAHSPLLRRFRSKWAPILPPVVLPPLLPGVVDAFDTRWDLAQHRPVIGFVARFAAEKGVEVIVAAMPRILQEYPQARVLFTGPYRNVLGEQAYAQRLAPMIERLGPHWVFTDIVSEQDLMALYATSDVLVLPSLNSTESFGLVQVEAMLHGSPIVASDRPGIRAPIQLTGMGELAPTGDPAGFAEAVLRVLRDRDRYVRPHTEIAVRFDIEQTVTLYERLFEDTVRNA